MHKYLRTTVSLLLSALIAFSFCGVFGFAAQEATALPSEPTVSVSAFDGDSTVNWWKSELDGKYYIFLPDASDASALKVTFTSKVLSVDGKQLTSGEITDAFSGGGEFTVDADGTQYDVVVLKSDELPAVYIETESGSLDAVHADKNYKERATFVAYSDGEKVYDADLEYIKGRGNSTWKLNKKPYNIKFESKVDLFGMGKAKKWSLIASANEQSLIRNKLTYDLADDVGLLYSSKSQHIDLYINGTYEGNYLVCESVEIGSTRVDIDDLEDINEEANPGIDIEECALAGTRGEIAGYTADSRKWVEIPNDPDDITGGYLIEFELYARYQLEVSGFVTKQGQPITMKSPEYASKAEIEYISSFYQEFEDAVYSETGYNSLGKHYSEYIDIDSMVKMYIIQELAMNLDAARTSFYLFKPQGEDKLYASPVWDFDYSLGKKYSGYRIDNTNPELWATRDDYLTDTRTGFVERLEPMPTLLSTLCTHKDFMSLVKKEWTDSFLPHLGDDRVDSLNDLIASLEASAVMDAIRWNRYKSGDVGENLKNFRANADGSIFSYKENGIPYKGIFR